MKRGARVLVGVGVIAVLGVFVLASVKKKSQPAGKEVRAEAVDRRRIEAWVRAPGDVQPERLVQVSSNVIGRVEELAVREGDKVRRGALLLRLDDERYRSAAAQIRARLDAAQANLAVAKANADLSKQHLARKEALAQQNLISPADLDDARTLASVDDARYAAAVEDARSLRAALAEAEKNLHETVFTAPIDGTVTALNIERGENVITGTMNNPGTVILTVSDLDTMEVQAEVDESDVVALAPGQSVKVLVDAMEDTTLTGYVASVGHSGRRSANSQGGQGISFEVKVRVVAPPPALRPGMSADVEVLTGERDSALAVPIQALCAHPEPVVERWERRREADADKRNANETAVSDTAGQSRAKLVEGVFVQKDGKARFCRVHLGLRGDTHVEIEGALSPGDKVITGPYRILRALRDGDLVKPEKQKGQKKKSGEK